MSKSNIDDLDKILEHWLKMIKAAVIIQRANQAVDNIDEVLVAEAKQAIQQELLKARIETLEWVIDNIYWPIEGDRQTVLDRIADLQKELKENSDGSTN